MLIFVRFFYHIFVYYYKLIYVCLMEELKELENKYNKDLEILKLKSKRMALECLLHAVECKEESNDSLDDIKKLKGNIKEINILLNSLI